MGEFGENDSEREQELELVASMYSAEEVKVEQKQNDGIWGTVGYDISLDRVRVLLEFWLPMGFPLEEKPRAVIGLSRGLLDSQENELLRRLRAQMDENYEILGRYGLIDLLLAAKDLVQDHNDAGGSCGICLDVIPLSEPVFRANCWHIYHTSCFAAWWKQIEKRRLDPGNKSAQEAVHLRQKLRGVEARMTEKEATVQRMQNELDVESSRSKALADFKGKYLDCLDLAVKNESNLPVTQREFVHQDESSLAKLGDAMERNIKDIKRDLSKEKARLKKIADEFVAEKTILEKKVIEEQQQEVECPLCKTTIQYSELEPFLESSSNSLVTAQDSDTLVPMAWRDTSNAMTNDYLSLLTQEQRDLMEAQRKQRQQLFEKQREKGSLIDPNDTSASDGVILGNQEIEEQIRNQECEENDNPNPNPNPDESSIEPSATPPPPPPSSSSTSQQQEIKQEEQSEKSQRGRGRGRGRGGRGRGRGRGRGKSKANTNQ